MDGLIPGAESCIEALEGLVQQAAAGLRSGLAGDGAVPAAAFAREQSRLHALAWIATCVESLRQLLQWGKELDREGRFGEVEQLILQIAVGEYAAQIGGGIPMSQGEYARIDDLGIDSGPVFRAPQMRKLLREGNSDAARRRLVELMLEQKGSSSFGATGLDEEMEEIRSQLRRFADEKVIPFAQQWHEGNMLIPAEMVRELAGMGIFGLTIAESHGGSGMAKQAMCVVSEELSRGYLGVGSLATRSEIAAELVAGGGTDAQKREWLPGIASGELLPTAVFTEPGAGSDLGSLQTRAERWGQGYRVSGNKIWITHAVRANLMTLIARTDPNSTDYRGLSMFLVRKTPGDDDQPFPDQGLSGTEIPVIGYRGMREYELGFDQFPIPESSLLGGTEGNGFRQLMETFESARIQTAARAIGVAQAALEGGLAHAIERVQFGRRLVEFPRVIAKLSMMAVEIMLCRQLTYHAASRKDRGRRCDLEAGMAKLLAARVAWAAADNSVQIHGGAGFATSCPASRILCDARILGIFEGASEIQADVIARRLLQPGRN